MKAMILAAGLGTRMRPLTDHCPKPLLKAGNDSLIGHLLTSLKESGYQDIVINHAWQGNKLEESLGTGQSRGLRIQYSREKEALETAGGIRQALHLLQSDSDEPFLVVNGDIWTEFPFIELQARADLLDCKQAHLVLVPNPAHHPKGDFHLDNEGLVHDAGQPAFTFSGIGLYRPSLFASVPQGVYPLAPVLRQAMKAGKASGELFTGAWMDIGTPERLKQLDAHLKAL